MKKRGFGQGKWNGVGGKIEADETIEEALVRECREEIDVIPMHYWKVARLTFHEFDNGKAHTMYVHVYFCDEWEREPVESEEMRPEWFLSEELQYDHMWPDDEYWLPQVLAGNKVVGEFQLDKSDAIIAHRIQVVEALPAESSEKI